MCGRQSGGWRFKTSKLTLIRSHKQFLFGSGPALRSLGGIAILIHVQTDTTDNVIQIALPIVVDVVNSNVPLLIAHD